MLKKYGSWSEIIWLNINITIIYARPRYKSSIIVLKQTKCIRCTSIIWYLSVNHISSRICFLRITYTNTTHFLFILVHQIRIIQNTLKIVEVSFVLVPGDEGIVSAFLSNVSSVCMCCLISSWGSLFPGGNKKHCSSFRFGVVVPCHDEGLGMTLPSQWTHPLGSSDCFKCSGNPVPVSRLASGTQGMIVPTGTSDNDVEGSKGS